MNHPNYLSEHKTLLLLMPSTNYNKFTFSIIKALSNKSVCYVTLNKTYASLKESFQENGVDITNMVFIDAITKTMKSVPDQTDGCYFAESPAAFTQLSILISKILKHNFDYLIFDSITNLLMYQDRALVAKFLTNISKQISRCDTRGIFYALNISQQEMLIKECSMLVEKVIDPMEERAMPRKVGRNPKKKI